MVPEEREGKTDDDPWLARNATAPATAAVSTRKGGYERPVQQKVCIVFDLIIVYICYFIYFLLVLDAGKSCFNNFQKFTFVE